MFATTSVNLSPHTLLALMEYLRDSGATTDPAEAVDTAVRHWLAAMKQDTGAPDAPRGYQWKSLFLPEGTVLRSWSYGENNYARVEGDKIIHEGKAVSPNQFAQSFARTTRNAWTDLYIRRPEDKQFKPACRLRQELAEQAERPAEPAPAMSRMRRCWR